MTPKEEFKKLNACDEAIEWIGNRTHQEAWQECERGDWMLWYYFKKKGFDKYLCKAKADCASLVKHLMKDQRSLDALKACYDYYEGVITVEDLAAAYAYAADAYAAAVYAYAYAADAYAYADAADAAAADAAAAAAADRQKTLKKCADICREVLTEQLFKD